MLDITTNRNNEHFLIKNWSIYLKTFFYRNNEHFLVKLCSLFLNLVEISGIGILGKKTANMIDIPIFFLGISGIGISGIGISSNST